MAFHTAAMNPSRNAEMQTRRREKLVTPLLAGPGYGIAAETWLEKMLSVPPASTAVVT
jgi:hypothetical protein